MPDPERPPKERKAPSEELLRKTGSDSETVARYPQGTRPLVGPDGEKHPVSRLQRLGKKLGP